MSLTKTTTHSVVQRLPLHPTWIEVDLAAIKHNYREIRRRVGPEPKVIASLKANAYGHGIVEFARILSDLDIYSVATGSFQDALAIRQAGLDVKIQMFAGHLPQAIPELLRYDLMPTVYNFYTARAVSAAATRPVPIYIKVDAGLSRLGVPIEEAEAFVQQVAALPNVVVEGLYTHLPYNNASGLAWAQPRLKQFDALVDALAQSGIEIPVTQSIASAGIVCGLESRCSAVCTGHLLYGGLSRVPPSLADLSAFRPVLTAIKSRLIHIEHHAEEKAIGMGGSQILKAGSTTGVIPVGAYDGYRKPAAGKRAVVLMRGRRMPVINITLEYTVLDLTDLEAPEIGQEVVLVGQSGGERIPLEELAAWSNGGPLDALMAFEGRLPCVTLPANR